MLAGGKLNIRNPANAPTRAREIRPSEGFPLNHAIQVKVTQMTNPSVEAKPSRPSSMLNEFIDPTSHTTLTTRPSQPNSTVNPNSQRRFTMSPPETRINAAMVWPRSFQRGLSFATSSRIPVTSTTPAARKRDNPNPPVTERLLSGAALHETSLGIGSGIKEEPMTTPKIQAPKTPTPPKSGIGARCSFRTPSGQSRMPHRCAIFRTSHVNATAAPNAVSLLGG